MKRTSIVCLALIALLACSRERAPNAPKAKALQPGAQQAQPTNSPAIKEGSMFSGKPYLTLRIETEFLQYEVYVNGAPVLQDYSGAPSNETMPVNQLLRSGANDIQIITIPWDLGEGKIGYHDQGKARLTLQLQESGALDQPALEVASLAFQGSAAGTPGVSAGSSPSGAFDSARKLEATGSGDVKVAAPRATKLDADGSLLIERRVEFPLIMLEWEFLRSDVVPTTYAATEEELNAPYEELLRAYEQIWTALKARNLDAVMPLFEERSRNTDRAFYFPPGTTQGKLRAAFQSALDDPSRELAPIRGEGSWNYEVGPSGRLMRLVHGERASAIIRFVDKGGDSGYRTTFPITFRKKGDRFIVAL